MIKKKDFVTLWRATFLVKFTRSNQDVLKNERNFRQIFGQAFAYSKYKILHKGQLFRETFILMITPNETHERD